MSVQSDLEAFAALLRKWNTAHNLVSRETVDALWPRHIEDSLQLMRLLGPADRDLIDLGSGGGFPAIPLAIASRGADRRFTLVEPIAKKAAFLRAAARELRLPLTILEQRAEDIDSRETFDVITSRALANLPQLMAYGIRLVRPGGRLLLHKGRTYREESSRAAQLFDYDMVVHQSGTEPGGVVLEISKLRAKSAA
ncbi:MAG TPA: 16S rRNA (guanine(527)-N(7))-methyltransferase RsmG [Devosia sp.]|nr:16S rRNA (guanine(527)-N(7))-methyltransferase RsmG [Devosia sp.]